MSIKREDRADMSALHAVANGTNASTSSLPRKRSYDTSTSGPWLNKPTIISVPSHSSERSVNATRSTRPGGNPYSRASLDNLHGQPRKTPEQKGTPRLNPMSLTVVPTSSISLHQSSSNADRGGIVKKRKLSAPTKSLTNQISAGRKVSSQGRQHSPPDEMSITPAFSEMDIGSPSSSKWDPKQDDPRRARYQTAFQNGTIQPSTPSSRSEVIDVDEDEDLGERVFITNAASDPLTPTYTSDDLKIASPSRSIGDILDVPPPSDQHVFNRSGLERGYKPVSFPAPYTAAIKEKLIAQQRASRSVGGGMHDIGDDPIEDIDEFDSISQSGPRRSSRPIPVEKNNVRQKVSEYERRMNKPPEVDLTMKGKNRVKGMKGKKSNGNSLLITKSENPPYLGKPPDTTSRQVDAPDFSYSPERGKNKTQPLPLEAYACGASIYSSVDPGGYQPKYWVHMRKDSIAITSEPLETGSIILEIDLRRDIKEVDFPRPDDMGDSPIISFKLYQNIENPKPNIRLDNAFDDDDMNRILIIKPLISHVNGSIAAVKRAVFWLRQVVTHSGIVVMYSPSCAHINLWEHLQQTSKQLTLTKATPSKTRLRARPDYNEAAQTFTVSNVTTSSTLPSQRIRRSPSAPADEVILLYPFTGTGAVNVTNGDLKRLEPGEFLNDTLIECGLKLWLSDLRMRQPEFAEEVHVFSPFFYTQLNQKNLEEGYRSVRKWTSRYDLFKKKYIIVPINEHLHWYLAIICHAERVLQHPSPTQASTPNVTTRTQGRKSLASNVTVVAPSHPPISATSAHSTAADELEVEQAIGITPDKVSKSGSRSSSSTALADDEPIVEEIIPATPSDEEDAPDIPDIPVESNPASPHLRPAKFQSKTTVPVSTFYAKFQQSKTDSNDEKSTIGDEEIDELRDDSLMDIDDPPLVEKSKLEEPHIFSFDSLGAPHTRALKVLSRYLEMEAKDKKGWINPLPAVVKKASVPTQPNYCDCGVYLLHFVEQFMSDPDTHFENIMSQNKSKKMTTVDRLDRERLWNHDLVAGRRQQLKEKILSLSAEWKQEKDLDGKGKGKGKEVEVEPSPAPAENGGDSSDIEVLEISPEPPKATNKALKAQRAFRIRGD